MKTHEKGLFLAVKRLISIGGLIFILLVSLYYESQTNFFYYLGLQKRVDILTNLKNLSDSDSTSILLEKEICQIYIELYDHSTFNLKDWRETIDKIPEWFQKDLPQSELEKKIIELEQQNRELTKKTENQSFWIIVLSVLAGIISIISLYTYLLNRTNLRHWISKLISRKTND